MVRVVKNITKGKMFLWQYLVQGQDFEANQGGKGVGMDVSQGVAMEVKLLEVNQVWKFTPTQVCQEVLLQVEDSELSEAAEGLIRDSLDPWGVKVELCQVFPADELVWNEGVSRQHVPIQIDSSGVHGDKLRDPGVVPGPTSDDVSGPGGIMEAVAPVRALHPAVTGKKVTAHAQSETVSLILAHEFWKRPMIWKWILHWQ